MEKEYERWVYGARMASTGWPVITHMLLQVCDNDAKRFEIGEGFLKLAFEAGFKAGSAKA